MSSPAPFSYPFRSRMVAEICAGLSDEECRELRATGGLELAAAAMWCPLATFGGTFLGRCLFPMRGAVVLAAVSGVVGIAGGAWIASRFRRKQGLFLASTAYARERGITADSIRWFQFF